jgi:hypothetical protein
VTIAGECFCGDIKYQVTGKLRDARSCHCSRCRKAFSSQASAYALVEPQEFEWLCGKDLLTSYIGKHIYVGSKASWELISEGVIQYEEVATENA